MTKTCVITGGHATPGLAVINKLKEKDWEIIWIGIEHALSDEKSKSLEAKVLPTLNIPFISIDAVKLNRTNPLSSVLSFYKIFNGFWQSIKILRKYKPEVVLSFGSFVSVPVCFAAWFLGIPIFIHEQTSASGLANRIVSSLADKIAISFESSKTYFPEEKVVLTGNPIRQEFFELAKKRKKTISRSPMLFITGGSRGSVLINTVITNALSQLVSKFKISHQTGEVDYKRVLQIKKKLNKKDQSKYAIFSSFTPQEASTFFGNADIIISRAGANTVSEIAILGIPAIFVPISWSESQEQLKNAKMLESVGAAEVIEEKDFDEKTLLSTLDKIIKNYSAYRKNTLKAGSLVKQDAADRIVNLITSTE